MTMRHIPTDAFTVHLSDCTAGCDVKSDGTGPLCAAGQRAMESVDWEALARIRDRAIGIFAVRLLAKLEGKGALS